VASARWLTKANALSALTEQSIEGHVSLDMRSANVLKNRGTFALRVRGDSNENVLTVYSMRQAVA
jgi:hypothetical protein